MISYDLAKELKKAGWEQPGCYYPEESVHVPSLSELVAACPIHHDHDHLCIKATALDRWCAGYMFAESSAWSWRFVREGSSPEEAVSRLWLKLKEGTV